MSTGNGVKTLIKTVRQDIFSDIRRVQNSPKFQQSDNFDFLSGLKKMLYLFQFKILNSKCCQFCIFNFFFSSENDTLNIVYHN